MDAPLGKIHRRKAVAEPIIKSKSLRIPQVSALNSAHTVHNIPTAGKRGGVTGGSTSMSMISMRSLKTASTFEVNEIRV